MAENKLHEEDDKFLNHVCVSKSTSGGHCLNRHIGYRAEHSCSHIWQAYKKMLTRTALYNDKADGVTGGKQCFLKSDAKEGESNVEWRVVRKKPAKDAWNVGGTHPGNFTEHCNEPYYHEAHHIIPNSTLNGTIQELFGDTKKTLRWFRGGLLDEGYNLNEMVNMIMLPNDQKVGRALKLPCHRVITPETNKRSHNVYSAQVKELLLSILSANVQDADKHDAPDYKAVRKDLEDLSGGLFDEIVAAGVAGTANLDSMGIL